MRIRGLPQTPPDTSQNDHRHGVGLTSIWHIPSGIQDLHIWITQSAQHSDVSTSVKEKHPPGDITSFVTYQAMAQMQAVCRTDPNRMPGKLPVIQPFRCHETGPL